MPDKMRDIAFEEQSHQYGIIFVDEAFSVIPGTRSIHVVPSAARAITLPYPHEMAGQTLLVQRRAGTGNVTIVDPQGTNSPVPYGTAGTETLTAEDDYSLIYCDGLSYFEIAGVQT